MWSRFCSKNKDFTFLFLLITKYQQRFYCFTHKPLYSLLVSTSAPHRSIRLLSQSKLSSSTANSSAAMHRTHLDPVVSNVNAALNQATRMLEVTYTENILSDESPTQRQVEQTEQFPFAWLRDSCRCPDCHHPTTHSRRIPLLHFDPNCRARAVEVQRLHFYF